MDKYRIDWQTGKVYRFMGYGYLFFKNFNQNEFEDEAELIDWLESE